MGDGLTLLGLHTPMSKSEIERALYGKRGSKYNVGPPETRTYKGIVFHSTREMEAFQYLEALERAGTIHDLERQVRFPLNGVSAATGKPEQVSTYVADFVCQDLEGRTCVYDAKGVRTSTYKTAKKWFELQYGLRIIEL